MIESGGRFPESAIFLEIDIEAQILFPFGWLNGMPRYCSQMKQRHRITFQSYNSPKNVTIVYPFIVFYPADFRIRLYIQSSLFTLLRMKSI